MLFFCYHRDRTGSTPLRSRMAEEHWSYMDRFAATMLARGPTFAADGTLTGSVHVLDLPGPTAARAFAFEEPCYQAGAYRDVLVRRFDNPPGRTQGDPVAGEADGPRYLVLGFTPGPAPAARAPELPSRAGLVVGGSLLSDDGALVLGTAALLRASDPDDARTVLPAESGVGVEVHQWRFGGRPG